MAFEVESGKLKVESESIRKLEKEWKAAAESTSSHLKVLSSEIRFPG